MPLIKPRTMFNYLEPTYIKNFIQTALTEDVGDGDHTSLSTIPSSAQGRAKLLVKDDGILAGVALAKLIFEEVDKQLTVKTILEDGAVIKKGEIV